MTMRGVQTCRKKRLRRWRKKIAIAPAALERGARLPVSAGLLLLLFAVVVSGVLSSAVAARAAARGSLLQALRSE